MSKQLSEREKQIVLLLARGYTIKRIARALGIAPKTVDSHLEHIRTKVGSRSAIALIRFAVKEGLASPEYVVPMAEATSAFKALAESKIAVDMSDKQIRLEVGHELKLVEATQKRSGSVEWLFEDRIGNRYRILGRLPRFERISAV